MKAVSPLVATAILLVVAVAGGVMIYNYMMSTLSSPQNYASLSVLSAKMLVDNNRNRTILNIKVSNIGTSTATIKSILITPDNITSELGVEVDPGTTKSINVVINQSLNPAEKYYVIVLYDDQETEPVRIQLIR